MANNATQDSLMAKKIFDTADADTKSLVCLALLVGILNFVIADNNLFIILLDLFICVGAIKSYFKNKKYAAKI